VSSPRLTECLDRPGTSSPQCLKGDGHQSDEECHQRSAGCGQIEKIDADDDELQQTGNNHIVENDSIAFYGLHEIKGMIREA